MCARGRLEEARQLYTRELRGTVAIYGPDHEETQTSRANVERFREEHPEVAVADA